MGLERAFAGVSSGIRYGAVTVTGEGMYSLPAGPKRYRVTGNLITDAEPTDITTPFSFTVDIEQAPIAQEHDEQGEDTDDGSDSSDGVWGGFTVPES